MPTDHESVFYLNVLDIPPKPTNLKTKNTLQLALRTRIKLFYRPQNISKTSQDIADHIKINKAGKALFIANPTAYFLLCLHYIIR
ncbi:MAG TPA: molecular chaperone [Arsenophonus sp.]